MYNGQIPIETPEELLWVDNFTFYGTLEFLRIERGRSAAHFIVRVLDVKHTQHQWLKQTIHAMFLVYTLETLRQAGETLTAVEEGRVTGWWTFYKRGSNYSIGPVKQP